MFQDESEQEPYLDAETNVLSAGGGTCVGEGGQKATNFIPIFLSNVLTKKEVTEQEKYCVEQCFEATYIDVSGLEMQTQGKTGSKKKPNRADAVALEFRPWAKPGDRCRCFYDCPMMGYLGSSLVRPKADPASGALLPPPNGADYMMRLHVNCGAKDVEGFLSVDFHCNPASYNSWPARMIEPPPPSLRRRSPPPPSPPPPSPPPPSPPPTPPPPPPPPPRPPCTISPPPPPSPPPSPPPPPPPSPPSPPPAPPAPPPPPPPPSPPPPSPSPPPPSPSPPSPSPPPPSPPFVYPKKCYWHSSGSFCVGRIGDHAALLWRHRMGFDMPVAWPWVHQ